MSTQQPRQVTAQIGGIPTLGIDVPISSVLLAVFVLLGAGHMTVFQINRRRHGKKFIFNGLLFGFTMSRIVANVFRIVWATRPTNSDIALVANVFLNAGILLVYVVNNLLAWRLVRSASPRIGWNPVLRVVNRVFLWGVLALIIPLIIIIVLRVKQPSLPHLNTAASVITRLAQTYFLIIAISPLVLITIAASKGNGGDVPDPISGNSWHRKIWILLASSCLAITEAGFRCGTTWAPAPLATDPAWWDSKAAFYCFNFGIDVCILATLLVTRIDRHFHVPNGSSTRASYRHDDPRDIEEEK